VGLGHFGISIVIVKNVGSQFYIDWVACDPQIFVVAPREVVTGFALVIGGIIDRNTGDNAVRRQHVRDIHALNYRPGMGGVNAVAVIITAAYFGVRLFEGNEAIDLLARNAL
jgi:hypothetical protein